MKFLLRSIAQFLIGLFVFLLLSCKSVLEICFWLDMVVDAHSLL